MSTLLLKNKKKNLFENEQRNIRCIVMMTLCHKYENKSTHAAP